MENSYIVPEATLTEIADAIREQTGGTEDIAIEDFAESIKRNKNNKITFSYFTTNSTTCNIYYVEGMTWKEFAESILNDISYIRYTTDSAIPPTVVLSDDDVRIMSSGGFQHIIDNVQSTDKILHQFNYTTTLVAGNFP